MAPLVRFDVFEADLSSGELWKAGARIPLREQCFQILALLLEQPGHVVTRADLRRRLWPDDVVVDFENNLNSAVARLREALGDSADRPRFVETLPKRGYRFLASVSYDAESPGPDHGLRARAIVLPFANLTGDPAQEYLADAITEQVITELSAVAPELGVIARTTAMQYKGSHKSVAHIGRELNVQYVVEGAVCRNGDCIAVPAQLIRASDQTHLFAKTYETEPASLFSIHRCIAQDIAAKIPFVTPELRVAAGSPPADGRPVAVNPGAYKEYIEARYLMGKATADAFASAAQHLQRAIARDPEFAGAYDALAQLHWGLGYAGFVPPVEAFSQGIKYALRALEIDNTRGETHALLGQFHKTIEYNWEEVEREMTLARRLDPASPIVRMRYALSGLMPHGRLDEAVEQLERALELDPLSAMTRFWLGIMLLLSRRYEQAIEECRQLLELDSASYLAYFVLSGCHRYQGRLAEAVAAQQKAVELSGGAAIMLGGLGLSLGAAGDAGQAREILQRLRTLAVNGYVPPSAFAFVHLGLGEIDDAFAWFDRAVDECDQRMMPIKSYALLDPIRSDPRFTALLRKMRLA